MSDETLHFEHGFMLRFGQRDANEERHAAAPDGATYTVRPPSDTADQWFWCMQDGTFDPGTEGVAATEVEAFDAARDHDRRRRNVTPPRAAGDGR